MADIMDYVLWRGDLSAAVSPWGQIDALIFACISYVEFTDAEGITLRQAMQGRSAPDGVTGFLRSCYVLAAKAAAADRYGDMRISGFVNTVDAADGKQFSAVTLHAPQGDTAVCFRGTDGTLVGWRQNFTMSYESPVPSQAAALEYLEAVLAATEGHVMVTGHSKGGNLAAWSAPHLTPSDQSRVQAVYSFDGPGMDDDTTAGDGYQRILPQLHSVIPQDSVVGLMMNYHENYRVVQSVNSGLRQHDPFSWQLNGTDFRWSQGISGISQVTRDALHDWLRDAEPAQREVFVDAVFDLLDATGASTTEELKQQKIRAVAAVLESGIKLPPEVRMLVGQQLGKLVRFSAMHTWDTYAAEPVEKLQSALHAVAQKAEQPRDKLTGALKDAFGYIRRAVGDQSAASRLPDGGNDRDRES